MTSTASDNSTMTAAQQIAERIRTVVLDPLKIDFVGKDEVIDLLGVSLVAGENLFILGPPGTAKSAIVRGLASRLEGRYFDYLLTRFTEPSELFGPFDIRKLRDGELQTNTEGMLPEGEIIFLDELLNANSAILNSLLMALNERVFRRGRETRDLGFVLTVGASNNLPEDEALAALFDRFLLRVQSNNVPDEQLGSVLQAGWQLQRSTGSRQAAQQTVSVADVLQLQACIPAIDVSGVRQSYVSLIHRLRHAGIEVSDRRAVRLQRLAAASALMCGRTEVHLSDLWVLRYIWDTMEQVEVLNKIVDEAIMAKAGDEAEVQVHPRSSGATAPDPEQLARDLEQIANDVAEATEDSRSWLSDRISILAARIEWVQQDASREFLRSRVAELRQQLSGAKVLTAKVSPAKVSD